MSRYTLRWSRTTPFTAEGRQGTWTVVWSQAGKHYIICLNGRTRGDTDTANEGKHMAEHLDGGQQVCPHCHGIGWI